MKILNSAKPPSAQNTSTTRKSELETLHRLTRLRVVLVLAQKTYERRYSSRSIHSSEPLVNASEPLDRS